MFKIKYKSINKKMKILSRNKHSMKQLVNYIDVKKLFLLNRYNLNIQSKYKLRTKWN